MTDIKRIIIGIDPGLAACGFASYLPDEDKVLGAITLRTSPKDGSDRDRLMKIARDFSLLLPMPEGIAVTLAIESQHARRGKWAEKFAADTMRGPAAVRGMLLYLAAERDWEVVELPASASKKALVGSTRASENQMVRMAFEGYRVKCSQHAANAIGFALAAKAREKIRR